MGNMPWTVILLIVMAPPGFRRNRKNVADMGGRARGEGRKRPRSIPHRPRWLPVENVYGINVLETSEIPPPPHLPPSLIKKQTLVLTS